MRYLISTLLILAGIIGLIESPFGKDRLRREAESLASKAINGKVTIGALRGNLFHDVTLSRLRVKDSDDKLVARIANVIMRIHLQDVFKLKPRIVIEKITIEQPEVLSFDQSILKANQPGESSGSSPFMLKRLQILEGKAASIGFNADLESVQGHLPEGKIWARGYWRGLPAYVAISARPATPQDANRLSGVAKRPLSHVQAVSGVGRIGRSFLEITGEGSFDSEAWYESEADLNLERAVYDPRDLQRMSKDLPGLPLESRAKIGVHSRALSAGAEVHLPNYGRILVEGSAAELPSVGRVRLTQLKFQSSCPVLVLHHPVDLQFRSDERLPIGTFELDGCGGKISYQKTSKHLIARGEKLNPEKFYKALPILKSLDFKLEDKHLTASAELRLNPPLQRAALVRLNATQESPSKYIADGSFLPAGAAKDIRFHVVHVEKAPLEWKLQSTDFEIGSLLPALKSSQALADFELSGKGTGERSTGHGALTLKTPKGVLISAYAEVRQDSVDARLTAHDAQIDSLFPILFDGDALVSGGILNADFHLAGPRLEPNIIGTLGLHANQLRLPTIGGTYDNVRLRVSGSQRQLNIEELSLEAGGRFLAQGAATFKNGLVLDRGELSAEFKDFRALAGEGVNVKTTGNLVLRRERGDPRISGNALIKSGSFTLPEKNNRNLESLSPLEDVVVAGAPPEEPGAGILSGVHAAVDIKFPGEFWLRDPSDDIKIELEGRIQAELRGQGTVFLTGPIKARRGYAEFFGRHFELKSALADFTGEPLKPMITAEGVYRASPSNIVVRITGDPEHLKPALSSDPPGLNEEQAIGVLLTGSPDYQSGTSGSRSAGGVAAGLLVSELQGKLRSTIPFDTLTADVSTDKNAAPKGVADESHSQVEVGKYVTDRIFLKLGREFATDTNESFNKLTLDYRLTNRWSIETIQTDAGRSDLEVLWTMNYR